MIRIKIRVSFQFIVKLFIVVLNTGALVFLSRANSNPVTGAIATS